MIPVVLYPLINNELKFVVQKTISGLAKSIPFVVCILVWALLLALGVLNSQNINETLSSARVFLYLLVAVYISSSTDLLTDKIMYLCIGITIGDLFEAAYLAESLSSAEHNNFNVIPIFILSSVSVLRRDISLIVVAIFLIALSTYTSAYRVVPLVGVGSVLYSLFISKIIEGRSKSFHVKNNSITVMFVIFFSIYSLYYLYNHIELSDFRYFRLVYRTTELLTFDFKDAIPGRISIFENMGDAFLHNIIPNGFATTGEYVKASDGSFRVMRGYHKDFPFIFFSYTFGFPLSLLIIVSSLFAGAIHTMGTIRYTTVYSEIDIVSTIFFPLSVFLLFFNGRFLFFPFAEGVMFGLLYGRWFRHVSSRT